MDDNVTLSQDTRADAPAIEQPQTSSVLDDAGNDQPDAIAAPTELPTAELVRAVMRDRLLDGIDREWVPGWENRAYRQNGEPLRFVPLGLVVHHTATAQDGRDYPTYDTILEGRKDEHGNVTLSPPLAQFGIGRSGKIYVFAAGHCNHAGRASWNGLDYNDDVWGIEAECSGVSGTWDPRTLATYPRLAAAIVRATGISIANVCSHKEWAESAGRDDKSDPVDIADDMDGFRRTVGALVGGIRQARPIKAVTLPTDFAAGTHWSHGFHFQRVPPLAFMLGLGSGAFVYEIDLPDYEVADEQASVTATLASGTDGPSEITLVVNDVVIGAQQTQAPAEGGGTLVQWGLSERVFKPRDRNKVEFRVPAGSAFSNGVSIFSTVDAASPEVRIRVSIPFETILPPPQPVYDAQFVSQSVPPLMIAGRSYPVSVRMRNIGDQLWRPGRVRLRSSQPDDNLTWGRNRVDLPDGLAVEPGSEANFAFDVTAPQALGPTMFRWGMIRENVAAFGQRNTAVTVMVAKDALFVRQQVPSIIVGGTTMPASATFRNIGDVPWTRGAGVHLAGHGPDGWGVSRVELPHDVASGADVTFAFSITAPAAAAKRSFQWQMRRGTAALGAPSPAFEVRVLPPLARAAHFVSQSVPSRMATSTAYKISVTMRNAGTTTWTAAAGFKLGSQNPQDNVRWGMSRVALPHDVPPNAEVTFAFIVATRAAASISGFQWQMLQEGREWFGQITPNVDVSVAVSTWQAAIRGFDGGLWVTGADNRGSMGLGMAAETSPSIAALRTGGWVTAFQANDTNLWIVGADNRGSLQLGMMPGTSPSIAALPAGGWQAAFQANDGKLWVTGADNRPLGRGMARGTSPSIAALSTGGWVTAFQADDGNLWVVGADNRGSLRLGMMPGTSPSIAALRTGGWQVAFQANDASLWVVGTDNRGSLRLGMMRGTSPSIAGLESGGWEAAFQANDGNLWVVGADNRGSLGLGMKAGTSPSIAAQPKGRWQAAFHGGDGRLWSVGAEQRGALDLGLAAGTSPSIAQLPPR